MLLSLGATVTGNTVKGLLYTLSKINGCMKVLYTLHCILIMERKMVDCCCLKWNEKGAVEREGKESEGERDMMTKYSTGRHVFLFD